MKCGFLARAARVRCYGSIDEVCILVEGEVFMRTKVIFLSLLIALGGFGSLQSSAQQDEDDGRYDRRGATGAWIAPLAIV